MTKGELKNVALALYKIAEVEEVINDVCVWPELGPDGIDNVAKLQEAMCALAKLIAKDTDRSGRTLKKEYQDDK